MPKVMKRGALKKSKARLINVWLPFEMFPLIDRGIIVEDSDRSKFVRRAIREKLCRLGIEAIKQ
jgi:metal-responsive CopG/Arc/MetJ family transcriptional regulator